MITSTHAPIHARCIYCVYEMRFSQPGKVTRAELDALPLATTTIETREGKRDVCEPHAAVGAWRRAS